MVPNSHIVISMMQEVHHATGKDDRSRVSATRVRDICYKLKIAVALNDNTRGRPLFLSGLARLMSCLPRSGG